MEDNKVILAIHTKERAVVLKQALEGRGIPVALERLLQDDEPDHAGERMIVRVEKTQLAKALNIIEEYKLFSYDSLRTHRDDDGRKRILVAVDFSSYSMKACQIAFSIAKEIDAKVKILHVYNNIYFPSHIPFADTFKKEEGEINLLDKSRKKMLGLCVDINNRIACGEFPSVNYSYSLREGLTEEEIESFIKEYKPMLLVLGTKGKNNNKNNVLGSVTADIIEMTNVPVIAVPENSPIQNITDVKHLAFFTNNVNKRDLISFEYLMNTLLRYQGVKITLIHVDTGYKKKEGISPESQLMALHEFFSKKYPMLNIGYKLIADTDLIAAIKNFVDEEQVKIIALNTRRRNLIGRIFIPSTSRKILSSLDVAILALRGEKLT